jgi:serine/threonine protein kinase
MGQVFLGRDGRHRMAAVKVIHETYLGDVEFRTRFAREIDIISTVRAPWTVAMLDADPEADRPWFAAEYVPGPSLEVAVRASGPLSVRAAGILASRLADALAALHSMTIVHRDLKPSNVIVAEDGPRLLDFGIARAADASRITHTGLAVGSPAFMSPERAGGEEGSVASDIFSLASVITFAATGTGPFGQVSNPITMLLRVTQSEPNLDAVPEPLRSELTPCLAKNPPDRPSAREVGSTLAHWITEPGAQAWPPPATTQYLLDAATAEVTERVPSSASPPPRVRLPDIPAGLTPTSTALRTLSVLFRRGRQPSPLTLGLLALPFVALLLLGTALLLSSHVAAPSPSTRPSEGAPSANSALPAGPDVLLKAALPAGTSTIPVSTAGHFSSQAYTIVACSGTPIDADVEIATAYSADWQDAADSVTQHVISYRDISGAQVLQQVISTERSKCSIWNSDGQIFILSEPVLPPAVGIDAQWAKCQKHAGPVPPDSYALMCTAYFARGTVISSINVAVQGDNAQATLSLFGRFATFTALQLAASGA